MKLTINCIYTMNLHLCMFQSILESILLLKTAHMQLRAVSHALLFGVENGFSVENESFSGN